MASPKPKETELVAPDPTPDVYEILFGGLDDLPPDQFEKRKEEIEAAAFDAVLAHTRGLPWKRTLDGISQTIAREVTAQAIVTNAHGIQVKIPVVLYDTTGPGDLGWSAYLHLGDKEGPCLNSGDTRVKELAERVLQARVHGKSYG